MVKNGFIAIVVMLAAFVLHSVAFAAEVVDLPTEELAKESVLPIFDKSQSVKNRTVTTAGRFDVNFVYGMALTEPVANVSKIGFSAYYNKDETNAFGLLYSNNIAGLSPYATQLESQFPGQVEKFSKAPMPQNTLLFDYNVKAFYGKMSLSKSAVINTMLLGSLSLGMIQFSNKSYPALAVGFGQKFYFTPQWALRFDLRLYANEAPVPFVKPGTTTYEDRLTFTTNLDFGLNYLF